MSTHTAHVGSCRDVVASAVAFSEEAVRPASLRAIHIASAVATSTTELAAFDKALARCGMHDRNLIVLSSVIPQGVRVVAHQGPVPLLPGKWGDRLYVVLAEARSAIAGDEVWAGLGWVQDPNTGEGLFVEHTAAGREELMSLIRSSLQSMQETRGREFGPARYELVGAACDGEPVCALVAAAYQVSGWSNESWSLP